MAMYTILLFAYCSFASFDQMFEYQTVSRQTLEIPSHFQHYDSEYSSHLLNYSFSLQQNIEFLQANKMLIHNQGSLSSSEFLKNSQLKIKQELLDDLDFMALLYQQQDFEEQQDHMLFEFTYHVDRLLVSTFVDLEFQKREDNIGLSTTYFLKPQHNLKAFITFPLYDWNKRNREDDEIKKPSYTIGFVGRYLKDNETYQRFFEYGYREDTPIEWQFNGEYWKYKKKSLMLRYRLEKKSISAYEISYQGDIQKHNMYDTSNLQTRWNLYRQQALLKYENLNWKTHWNYESGLSLFHRHVQDIATTSLLSDAIPFVIFHDRRPYKLGYVSYGYDFTGHINKGPLSEDAIENRFNFFWHIPFKTAKLRMAFTFDLDDITSHPWEGGHASFEMLF